MEIKEKITEIKKRVFVFNFLLWEFFKTCESIENGVVNCMYLLPSFNSEQVVASSVSFISTVTFSGVF